MEVYALCVLVLFLKMLAISCYQGFFRLRFRAFTNHEDAAFFHRDANPQELPQVSRAEKAWANDLENIPLFFILGACAWRWKRQAPLPRGCSVCSPLPV